VDGFVPNLDLADCTHLNGCQIFGQFGIFKSKSVLIFGFPHIASKMFRASGSGGVPHRVTRLKPLVLRLPFEVKFLAHAAST